MPIHFAVWDTHRGRKAVILVLGLLLSLICVSALADIEINETNFPDANFRQYIIDAGFDTDGNGTLSEAEIGNVTEINCRSKSISTLTGIEYFAALTSLNCYGNRLTRLDVSKCTALTILNCSFTRLIVLDVSKNTALTELYCSSNNLTVLDVQCLSRFFWNCILSIFIPKG